jgi:hypothetical protein
MRALLAAIALCAAPAAVAQSGIWSGGVGAEYTSGDYGTGTTTNILAVPFSLKYDSAPWALKFTLPWYRVSGGGTVIPGLGAADNSNRRGDRSVSGIGDLTVSATNSAYYDSASQFGVDFTGKVKLPTGEEEKGLSSGSSDLTLRADAHKQLNSFTAFGGGGVLLSSGGFLDLKTALVYTLGGSQKLDTRNSVGLSLDGRSAIVRGTAPQRELTAFWSRAVEKQQKIQAYFLVGLANGSPDWGVGASILHAF